MSYRDSQIDLQAHSKAKLRLLKEYLTHYLRIIINAGFTDKIKIYDLFCGEGIYPNGGKGSPIIILDTLNEVIAEFEQKSKKIPVVEFLFNDYGYLEDDKSKPKIIKLREVVNNYTMHPNWWGKMSYLAKDYKDIVKLTINEIKGFSNREKAFVFIDPYTYSNIEAEEIRRILGNKKSEVLLWLPANHMYRVGRRKEPQEAMKRFIEQLINLEDWKTNFNFFEFVDQLTDAFRQFLGNKFYVDRFIIEKSTSARYCLLFFTSHIKGFEVMIESKWTIDEEHGIRWKKASSSEQLIIGQEAEKSTAATIKLEEKMKALLSHKTVTNKELYEFVLRCGFHPSKHANELLFEWEHKEKILDINRQTTSNSGYYLNYSNYKATTPIKATFKLKVRGGK